MCQLVLYKVGRHFFHVRLGFQDWRIQIYYRNFSGSKWHCYGNKIYAKKITI